MDARKAVIGPQPTTIILSAMRHFLGAFPPQRILSARLFICQNTKCSVTEIFSAEEMIYVFKLIKKLLFYFNGVFSED